MLTRGLIGSLLIASGGLVVSVLPDSTPLLRLGWLVWLRDHESGRIGGLAVVVLGLALLAAAWLDLCRHVARQNPARDPGQDPAHHPAQDPGAPRQGPAQVWHAAALWAAPLVWAPPLFSRDGWSYAAQGMMTRVGLSPYDYGPGVLTGPIIEAVDPRWLATGTPYGPLPLLLGSVVAEGTGSPWLLVIGHRFLALLGLVMLAWAVPRMAAWTGRDPVLACAFVIASPVALVTGIGGLHNDVLMVGLMAVALVVAVERGWWWGAALGGLAAAVKLPGGLVCVGIALAAVPVGAGLRPRLRRFASVGAVAVGTLVGLGLVAGIGLGWIEMLSVPGSVNTPLSLPTVLGQALDGLVRLLGFSPLPSALRDGVRDAAGVVSLLLLGWLALRSPTGARGDALLAGTLAVVIALACAPAVRLWYLLWLLPFVACLPMSRRWAERLVQVVTILGLVAVFDSTYAGRAMAIAVGVVLCLAAAAWLLAGRRGRDLVSEVAEGLTRNAASRTAPKPPAGASAALGMPSGAES